MRDFYAVANTPQHLKQVWRHSLLHLPCPYDANGGQGHQRQLGEQRAREYSPVTANSDFRVMPLNVHQDFISKNPYFSKQIGSLHYEDKEKCIPLQAADSVHMKEEIPGSEDI